VIRNELLTRPDAKIYSQRGAIEQIVYRSAPAQWLMAACWFRRAETAPTAVAAFIHSIPLVL
jgi:hypothetical protein